MIYQNRGSAIFVYKNREILGTPNVGVTPKRGRASAGVIQGSHSGVIFKNPEVIPGYGPVVKWYYAASVPII
ncbi:MAG: hypothetical protein A3G59_00205 [Candidatus Taylorbacteria bacterium RIFCSPLOWO2_12_FULL_47_20]|uniref:Uncharacterized protein n=2 Tax=Candidatus Tayloriibacteriota TaxID=1817919 RepID=A0A1G2P7A2_9BACT|nr:MAG: hypothetical protein A3H68_00590 [Candidatus Taylorbacteria bacterium RIFCSPLOWO2_02_FULL_46_40]OHA44226.1 MAG: hypothetical protein A3G59_00205 [Candidatus Taylorbacteria bacterium RIFCSPLOWO2_12_FULL_47_20]